MPATLPAPIRTQLAATRTRLRLVDLALGLARAVLAVSLALVILFTLDTTLKPPLGVLRSFALFVAMLAGLGATGFLASPLRRRLSDDDVAILIEGEYPELHGGLVSSVQLSRELDRDDLYTSTALIEATIANTATAVRGEDYGRVVHTGPLVPLWGLIAAFLVMGGMLFSNPTVAEYGAIFVQRVVYGEDVVYPTLVGFEVDQPEVIQVAKGDDLELNVHVTKGSSLLERLVIHTEYEGTSEDEGLFGSGSRQESRDLLRKGPDRFTKAYQNVTEPFSFWVESPEHGVRSRRHKVVVIQRPRIEQYAFSLRYPDYVGKPPETVSQPDLQVPAGTVVTYFALSNKPLVSAKLMFEKEGRPPTREERRRGVRRTYDASEATGDAAPTLRGSLGPDAFDGEGPFAELGPTVRGLKKVAPESLKAQALLGRFTVEGDMRFRFELTSKEELATGKQPVVFTVRVVRDRRPVVRIPVPGRRKQVTPTAKVPIEIDVRDDYGIASAELRLRKLKGDSEEAGEWIRVDLSGVQEGAKRARLKYTIDMADRRLQPGDRLRYFAKAYDQNLDKTANFDSSRTYEIQIVRPEDLERILQDRLATLKERLKAAERDQDAARKTAQPFVKALQPKVGSPLSNQDRTSIRRIEYEQRRVTNRLVAVKAELEDIKGEREANRLTEPSAMALIEELHAGVKDLSDRASPLVSRELEDTRKAPRLDPKTHSRLSRVPDLQEEIQTAIKRLIASIDKFGDFTEVLQEFQDLLKGEGDVIKGTKRVIKEGYGD